MRGWAARPGPHRWEERSDVRGGEREREPERGGVRETERVRTRRDRQGTGARMTSAAAEPLAATQAEQEGLLE